MFNALTWYIHQLFIFNLFLPIFHWIGLSSSVFLAQANPWRTFQSTFPAIYIDHINTYAFDSFFFYFGNTISIQRKSPNFKMVARWKSFGREEILLEMYVIGDQSENNLEYWMKLLWCLRLATAHNGRLVDR